MNGRAVAERILVDAINRARRKDVLGYFLRSGMVFLCDIAVQNGIPREEWFKDFETAYDSAVEHDKKKVAHA